jgi:hypothetical protein
MERAEGTQAETARIEPPAVGEFSRYGGPAGGLAIRVAIADIAVEITGLPDALADPLAAAYGPFLGPPTGAGRPLHVETLRAPLEYFVPPGFARGREYYRMPTSLDGRLFRTVSYRLASWIDLDARRGQIALAAGELDPAPRALENFLRSSVAWLALDAGGFFLHGASIVRGDRCHLFYGPSGAGKSTLSAMNDEGRVISDDLTLVLRRDGDLAACGGPFRGTYRKGEPVVGAFPVAGFYRLRKDDRTFVAPDDGGCFADLVGNLPFVVDQLPGRPDLMDAVRAAVRGASFRYLHFRKDAPFWPAIDATK